MNKTNNKMSADDIEALLPWYAAGTLDAREADEVEAALAADQELARRFDLVREEMTETILLNEALGVPSARVMENLFKAIDKERKAARAPLARAGLGAWLTDLFTPRAFAFAAGAAAIVILLQAGVITKLMLQQPAGEIASTKGSGGFETASACPPTCVEKGAFVLVRFASQASIADITKFLDGRDAVIVDGPRPGGAAGMYRVRVAEMQLPKDELDKVVKEFQAAGNLVSLAMPAP
jgi:putative zinc finger protein